MTKKVKLGNVTLIVGTYATPSDGWAGWIEPEDKKWVLFVPPAGKRRKPEFFGKRKKNGVVVEENGPHGF